MPEPSWHQNHRKRRARARLYLRGLRRQPRRKDRFLRALAVLRSHHGSTPPRIVYRDSAIAMKSAWTCRWCSTVMTMTQERCLTCHTNWQQAMWRTKRSKSRPKNAKAKEQANLSPFRKVGKEGPWVASSPMPRMTEARAAAREAKEAGSSSAPKDQKKEAGSEIPTEEAAVKEKLKTYIQSTEDLDPSIKSAIAKLIQDDKDVNADGVKHVHLNKLEALKKSIGKLQQRVKSADQEWIKFKSIMKKKYQEQKDAYKEQRKLLATTLSQKALEYQDAMHELKKRANAEQSPMEQELLSEELTTKLLQRRRALGNRGLRGGGGHRARREEIKEPGRRTLQALQTQESIGSEEKEHGGADAAPRPLFEAAAWTSIHLRELLQKIDTLSPYHQAFCLTMVCLACLAFEVAQYMVCCKILWVALAFGVGIGLHTFYQQCEKACRCRTFCCVGRRRYARRDFVREGRSNLNRNILFYLLLWHDLGAMVHAENVPAREGITNDHLRTSISNFGVFDGCFDGTGSCYKIFEQIVNMSASWTSGVGSVDLMALQRPVWEQVHEARQAAFERNVIFGENEIVQEVTALNQHGEQEFCLMTHAIRDNHEGSRELWVNLQNGDDFLDLIFEIRQRWSDVIDPMRVAALIYVIPQPPPSTTRGSDCLHLILDGSPWLGGQRNLAAMSFEYNDGTRSDVWFQSQRNENEIDADTLLNNLKLKSTCLSEAVTCTCRAGLTVFSEGVIFQNQDGLCITVQVEIGMVEAEGDQHSLMARRFNMNRVMAYVYRLGTDEPIYVQLGGLPAEQRMNFVRDTLADRPGSSAQGSSFFHEMLDVPIEFRERDIWMLIQEFTSTKREGFVIVMLDVDVFEQSITPQARPSDGWREVTYVRKEATRELFLQDAELEVFCRRGESNCHVDENGAPWHESDETTHNLQDGSYLKVAVQSQRVDLPFCMQWEQAQQGIHLHDMVDTRAVRKRQRIQEEGSSESSDSTTLLQVDSSLGRNFGREKRDKLQPPGNGVSFESEVEVFQGSAKKRLHDRSMNNNHIAAFCETRSDEPFPDLFLEFIQKVRFRELDDNSSEDVNEEGDRPRVLSLEHHLPILHEHGDNINEIMTDLKKDPAAKYPLRHDWHVIKDLHPVVKRVLDAQQNLLTGSVIRMHIFLDGSAVCKDGMKRAAWSFVVALEHDNAAAPNCKIVGFTGAPLSPSHLSDYHIGEDACDSGEAECAAMFWAGIWLLSWGKRCMIETVVHGDNLPTVKSSTAEWRCPPSSGRLHEKCRCLWQRIESEGFPVSLRHLHGHKGHPGNEAADSVAKHFAMTNEIFTGRRTKLAKLLAMHREKLRGFGGARSPWHCLSLVARGSSTMARNPKKICRQKKRTRTRRNASVSTCPWCQWTCSPGWTRKLAW